jgi:uncharacterized membrane protein affecting hemolysin expression
MTILKNYTILKKVILVLAIVLCFAFLGYYFGKQQTSQEVKEVEELATHTFIIQLATEFEFRIVEGPEEEASFKIILAAAK